MEHLDTHKWLIACLIDALAFSHALVRLTLFSMNMRRGLLLCCFLACLITVFQFKRFVLHDVRHIINPPKSMAKSDNVDSVQLQSVQRASLGFPNASSQVTVIGPIDDKRTIKMAHRASNMLARRWWRGRACAPERPLIDYFFGGSPAVSTHHYWSEAFLRRTVISIADRNYANSISGPFKITLLSQLSSNRFYMLALIASKWEGPMNVAVYTKPKDILTMYTRVNTFLQTSARTNIMVHVVVAEGDLYPVNWLRNLVLRNSSTPYIFMIDGDFLPSGHLEAELRIEFQKTAQSKADDTVLIVPAFEVLHGSTDRIPDDKRTLLKMIHSSKADVFHRSHYPHGHSLWQFNKWQHTSKPYYLYHSEPCSELAEPYMAMKRSESPLLPETLLHRNKNKIAYFFELCNSGKRFMVIPNEFVIHKYHASSKGLEKFVTMCVDDAWEVFRDYVLKKYEKTALYKISFKERFKAFKSAFSGIFSDFIFCFVLLIPIIGLLYLCSTKYF